MNPYSEDELPLPEGFCDIYIPFVAKLLEANPKRILDIYEFSTRYFEEKVAERDGVLTDEYANLLRDPNRRKEIPRKKWDKTASRAPYDKVVPNKAQQEPCISYDGFIELHPSSPSFSWDDLEFLTHDSNIPSPPLQSSSLSNLPKGEISYSSDIQDTIEAAVVKRQELLNEIYEVIEFMHLFLDYVMTLTRLVDGLSRELHVSQQLDGVLKVKEHIAEVKAKFAGIKDLAESRKKDIKSPVDCQRCSVETQTDEKCECCGKCLLRKIVCTGMDESSKLQDIAHIMTLSQELLKSIEEKITPERIEDERKKVKGPFTDDKSISLLTKKDASTAPKSIARSIRKLIGKASKESKSISKETKHTTKFKRKGATKESPDSAEEFSFFKPETETTLGSSDESSQLEKDLEVAKGLIIITPLEIEQLKGATKEYESPPRQKSKSDYGTSSAREDVSETKAPSKFLKRLTLEDIAKLDSEWCDECVSSSLSDAETKTSSDEIEHVLEIDTAVSDETESVLVLHGPHEEPKETLVVQEAFGANLIRGLGGCFHGTIVESPHVIEPTDVVEYPDYIESADVIESPIDTPKVEPMSTETAEHAEVFNMKTPHKTAKVSSFSDTSINQQYSVEKGTADNKETFIAETTTDEPGIPDRKTVNVPFPPDLFQIPLHSSQHLQDQQTPFKLKPAVVPCNGKNWLRTYLTFLKIKKLEREPVTEDECPSESMTVLGSPSWIPHSYENQKTNYFSLNFGSAVRSWYFTRRLRYLEEQQNLAS